VTALLALIHAPDEVDPFLMTDPALTESMFTSEKNLAAFRALASTATVRDAIEAADPGASDLLLQLSVAEPISGPVEAVAALVRQAARRAVHASTTPIPPEVHQWLLAVNEPETQRDAIEQLLVWLGSRSEDGEHE